MSNQIVISNGAKVRSLEGVLTGTAGIVNALGINVANGIPQLDGSGKILVSQLPNSVMEYKGTWNAATNTPTLVNGTGNQGDVYLCNVAGTVDFGAGPIVFFVGDQVIYSGTIWQRASGASGSVTSVAVTESGDALTITGSPITTSGTINIGFAGTSGQYINGAGGLTSFPSLTGFVPYTGATANVNLGAFDLTADVITGATGSFASSGGSNTFDINHSSGSGIALNITKGGNGEGLYINKTSGTGNAATIVGNLGGTSATFSSTLGVTGALNGTTASFTGSLTAQRGNFNQGASSGYAISMKNRNANQEWGLIVDTDAVDDKNLGLYSSAAAMYILRIAASTGAATFFSRITSNNSIVVNRVDNGDYLALKIENRPITAGNTASGFIAFYSNSGDATNDTYSSGRIYSRFDTNSYNSARISLATVTGNEIYQDVLTAKDTNVGIGTINPAQTLHLFTTSGTGSGVGTAIQIQSAGTGADQGWVGVNKGTGNGLTLSVQTNNIIFNTGASTPFGGTERMRITNGGDVGIGIVNPSAKLDVNGTGNFSGALSGTSATFSSSVTANSLIKTGGTSAQILAADGSVITAGTNITISGGTISSSGAITGSGTTNYVTKFTGASSIGNSLIFDNGTNVGIGLTSPSYKLDVQDNGVSGIVDVASFSVTGNGGSGRGVGILLGAAGSSSSVQVARLVGYHELANPVAVASSFAIQVANSSGVLTERLRITQAGNLIINTTTDGGFRLNVNGTGNFTGALTGTSATFSSGVTAFGLVATDGAYQTQIGVMGTDGYLQALKSSDASATNLRFYTGINERMRITSTGNVGIGTSSPAYTLDIYKSGGALRIYNTSNPSALATYSKDLGAIITSYYSASGSPFTRTMDIVSNADAGAESQMRFLTATSGGNPAVALTITSGGNVGIGTTSPAATLQIGDGTANSFMRIRALDGGAIVFNKGANNASFIGDAQAGLGSGDGLMLYTYSGTSRPILFYPAGVEAMRITSTGNVGIATTSPIGGVFKLQVGDGSADTRALIVSNSVYQLGYRNGSGNPVFYEGSDTSGNKIFSNNAGNELMRITSGGNVGIGNTGNSVVRLNITGVDSTSSNFGLNVINSSGTPLIQLRNDGQFRSGDAANSPYNYTVTGRALFVDSSGFFGYLASVRESKTNINSLSDISWLYKLNAVSFNYRKKDDDNNYTEKAQEDTYYGLIADEVEKVNKDLVFYNIKEDGTKILAGVEYNKLISALVKSVQELKLEIEQLKNK